MFDIAGGDRANVALMDISDHWAVKAIEALMQVGVINGYSDATFKPDQTISREEMAVIMSRILNLQNIKQDGKMTFTDIDDSYAKEEIATAAKAGILNGTAKDKFNPTGTSTRAEALTVIMNILNLNQQIRELLDTLK
ncbi:S-layer homology domain-containing protein [Paenibacillus sp. CMAA1364]